jgi:hypothetical protein
MSGYIGILEDPGMEKWMAAQQDPDYWRKKGGKRP